MPRRRLLRSGTPAYYALLVLCVVLLRLPTFDAGFIPEGDAELLLVGRLVADGLAPYTEVKTDLSPITIMLGTGMAWLFGSLALWVLKILAAIATFALALAAQAYLEGNKFSQQPSTLPAFGTAVLLSMPWQAQALYPMVCLLPLVLLLFGRAFAIAERKRMSWNTLFGMGFLGAVIVGLEIRLLPMVLGAFVVLFSIRSPSLADVLNLLGGVLFWVMPFAGYLFLGGKAWAWATQAGLPLITSGGRWHAILEHPFGMWLLLYWGLWVLLALLGWVTFRLRYYRFTVRSRQAEAVLLAWVLGGILVAYLSVGRGQPAVLMWLLAPQAIYVTMFLDEGLSKRPRRVLQLVLLALTGVALGSYLLADSLTGSATAKAVGLAESKELISRSGPKILDDVKPGTRIWLVGAPTLRPYLLHELRPSIGFLNTTAWGKIETALKRAGGDDLRAADRQLLEDVAGQILQQQPAYIFGEPQEMQLLMAKLPIVAREYSIAPNTQQQGGMIGYRRTGATAGR